MRVTLDIDEIKLRNIIKETGQKKKSPALAQALDEFLEDRKRKKFLARVMEGKTNYAASNKEIEDLSSLER